MSELSLGQFAGKRTHDLYFNTTPAGLHSFLELYNFYIIFICHAVQNFYDGPLIGKDPLMMIFVDMCTVRC